MDSQIAQTERNIQQIELQKLGQDLQAEAQMSIFPEPLPELPEPQLGPKRTFVTPVKQEAPTVPRGPRRNATAEIIGGVAQVASFALGPAGGAVNAGLLGGAGGTLFGTGAAAAGNLTSGLNAIGAGIGALAPR